MRRSASGSRVSDQSPSPSPPRSQSATFMEDDVELLLPRYDPSSQPGKREKSRLRSAENVIHFIPLLLLLCVVILWLFSHSVSFQANLLRFSTYTNRRYFASFRQIL
ncbi:hypothetical protein IGI04_001850 [Brassica rapa subsp. trilocularis]|uniref:Transmembrane protein n=1 Tax=Brassica rapa subsp. trilocularis TaxID=1813537 RepID=A0ABQ7NTZ7_BRACM|nr:hypothetical protein IGI04_001850 [Brassica rapa subsp. trilocularis]